MKLAVFLYKFLTSFNMAASCTTPDSDLSDVSAAGKKLYKLLDYHSFSQFKDMQFQSTQCQYIRDTMSLISIGISSFGDQLHLLDCISTFKVEQSAKL